MNVRFYLGGRGSSKWALSHLPDESFMTSPQIEVLNDVGHKRLIKQIKCNTNAGAEWIVSKIKHYPCDIINYINRLTSKYLDQGTLIEKFIKYSLFYMLIKNQVLILSMWKKDNFTGRGISWLRLAISLVTRVLSTGLMISGSSLLFQYPFGISICE